MPLNLPFPAASVGLLLALSFLAALTSCTGASPRRATAVQSISQEGRDAQREAREYRQHDRIQHCREPKKKD